MVVSGCPSARRERALFNGARLRPRMAIAARDGCGRPARSLVWACWNLCRFSARQPSSEARTSAAAAEGARETTRRPVVRQASATAFTAVVLPAPVGPMPTTSSVTESRVSPQRVCWTAVSRRRCSPSSMSRVVYRAAPCSVNTLCPLDRAQRRTGCLLLFGGQVEVDVGGEPDREVGLSSDGDDGVRRGASVRGRGEPVGAQLSFGLGDEVPLRPCGLLLRNDRDNGPCDLANRELGERGGGDREPVLDEMVVGVV